MAHVSSGLSKARRELKKGHIAEFFGRDSRFCISR